jgi:hypothetical protein
VFVIRPRDSYSYAYLLGAYLGDGYVANTGRSFQLVITLDAVYPDIIEECRAAIVLSLPAARPCARPHAVHRSVRVEAGSKLWPDLFPQMGPRAQARAPDRPSPLAARDRRGPPLALRARADPLRRLSNRQPLQDAAAVRARGRVRLSAVLLQQPLEDIRRLFCESCERLGLRWTQSNHRNISVSHRTSVALLDENVGPRC